MVYFDKILLLCYYLQPFHTWQQMRCACTKESAAKYETGL